MKKYLIVLSILLAGNAFAQTEHLTILHFNDLHGHVEQGARIAAKIREIEKENRSKCYRTMVLFGGDLISGTPVSTLYKGAAEGKLLNLIGVDAMAIGNHEFDYGISQFESNVASYEFPVVSANTFVKKTGKHLVRPYVIKENAGCSDVLNVGIFGLAYKGTPFVTNPKNVSTLSFTDPIAAARSAMKNLSKDAAVRIALTHEGVDDDVRLAKKVSGIDVVVGGHDHVKPEQYCRDVGNVPVCQTPPNGNYLGRIDLTIEDGKVVDKKELLIQIDKSIKPDKEASKLLAPFFGKLDKETKEIIGYAQKDANKEYLGAIISDSIREYMEADFGLMNSGSIRRTLKKGNITKGDIMEVLPFQNVVLKIEMKGKNIQKLILSSGKKRASLFLIGPVSVEDLEPNRLYTIATVDFLKNGGDGYTELKRARTVKDSGRMIRDIFIDHMKKEGKI